MDIVIRAIVPEEFPRFHSAVLAGFGSDAREEETERWRAGIATERTYCAFDGEEMVGTCADLAFEVTVPGSMGVPMSGTTVVTVRSTHRRRGILTAMMRAHIDATHERGEPLAGLWASETAIYPRYGFGWATDRYDVTIDTRATGELGDVPLDRVDLLEAAEGQKLIPDVYEGWRSTRVGALSRSASHWANWRFPDEEHHRDGASARRYAVSRREGSGITGYALYRQAEKWDDMVAQGTVRVIEVIGNDDQATLSLWRHLLTIDLFPTVKWWNAPVDFNLHWQMPNARAVTRARGDGLWVRTVDVAEALSRRAYAADGRIGIRIHDDFCPWNDGTYEVVVDGGVATCTRSSASADLEMTATTLGALYLGARRPSELAAVGLVAGDAAALSTADSLFLWHPQPWCPEMF